jgi:radical SAM superfamily enzyme YgiQ (UPF0313 family)
VVLTDQNLVLRREVRQLAHYLLGPLPELEDEAALTPPAHQVVLCNENVEPVDLETDADVVGITGFVIHRRRMLQLIEAFWGRGKLVALGGSFATLCPEEFEDKVDVLFVGEAEYTWPRFVHECAAGRWQPVYREDDKPSLLDSPCPRFELLKTSRYRSLAIQFGRGCPYSCEFCDIIVMYGRRPRTKTVSMGLPPLRRAVQPRGRCRRRSSTAISRRRSASHTGRW